jgi:2'-5' RNA ligase
VSPLPTQMTNHWHERPGRRPGRELYHWHMLFHDQPRVRELVAAAQEKLTGQEGLDMIDMSWLHMTTYVAGFADEVSASAVEAMTADARERLSHVAPVEVSLGPVFYASNAIVLPVEPPGALTPVHDAVRAATHAAGCDGQSATDPWLPHVSVAYSNATIPAAPIIAALGRSLPRTDILIRSISLVAQTQVGRSWQWRPITEVHLGQAA